MLPILANVFGSVIMPLTVGYALWVWVANNFSDYPLAAKIGFIYSAGLGTTGTLFTLVLMTNLPFGILWVFAILLCSIISIAIAMYLHKYNFLARIKAEKESNIYRSTFNAIIILMGILLGIQAINKPVLDWDALTLYDFRAKIFASGHSLNELRQDFTDKFNTFDYYYSYPFATSALHASVYVLGGTSPMLIYVSLYLALAAGMTMVSTNPLVQSVAVVLTVFNPVLFNHATIAYTNLIYANLLLYSVIFIQKAISKNNAVFYWLSVAFLIFSSFTRLSDPLYFANIGLMIYYSYKYRKYMPGLLGIVIFFGLRKFWSDFTLASFSGQNSTVVTVTPSVILEHLNIRDLASRMSFLISNYLIYLKIPVAISAGLAVLGWIQTRKIDIVWLIYTLVTAFILIVGGYYFTLEFTFWKDIGPSASRMVIPLICIMNFLGIQIYAQLSEKRNHKLL